MHVLEKRIGGLEGWDHDLHAISQQQKEGDATCPCTEEQDVEDPCAGCEGIQRRDGRGAPAQVKVGADTV